MIKFIRNIRYYCSGRAWKDIGFREWLYCKTLPLPTKEQLNDLSSTKPGLVKSYIEPLGSVTDEINYINSIQLTNIPNTDTVIPYMFILKSFFKNRGKR